MVSIAVHQSTSTRWWPGRMSLHPSSYPSYSSYPSSHRSTQPSPSTRYSLIVIAPNVAGHPDEQQPAPEVLKRGLVTRVDELILRVGVDALATRRRRGCSEEVTYRLEGDDAINLQER